MNEFQQAKRIVVKVGSSTLTYPTGGMNLRRIEELSKVISDLKNQGRQVVLVSSGAIAAGMGETGDTGCNNTDCNLCGECTNPQ